MPQRIEDASEVVVGRFYVVPTIYNPNMPKNLTIIPVVGPAHEDADIIGFPHRHVHPDRRFVSDDWMNFNNWPDSDRKHWAIVYSFYIEDDPARPFITTGATGVEWREPRVMKCKRVVPPFRDDAPWRTKLEIAYRSEELRDGHICPHRGISCRGVQVDDAGCVVCPGHGLQWDMATRAMVPRKSAQLGLRLK